jgi:hypothetical protein
MIQTNDELSEFSEAVYTAMAELLGHPYLGNRPLQFEKGYLERRTITIIKCISISADEWYAVNAQPKTVLYAVVINTIDEFLEESSDKEDEPEFWTKLTEFMLAERTNILEKTKKLKNGDKINIDEYHRELKERLNVNVY